MKLRLFWAFLLVALAAAPASAQTIGVYFDADGTSNAGAIPNGTTGHLYIVAVLGGETAGGITGSEFRVTGLPEGWVATSTMGPGANVQIGDPFSSVGVNMAFPVCQERASVVLYTVDVQATTDVSDQVLQVEHRNPPANPYWPCPLVTLCGMPYDKVCMTGGDAIINPTPGATVPVQPASWSSVKALYN